nr:S8 family serine peptidase [uncultured Desulfuromonas sp.]
MKRTSCFVCGILLLLSATVQAATVHLGGMAFDPLDNATQQRLSDVLFVAEDSQQPVKQTVSADTAGHYFVVQFDGPILEEWRHSLENFGATVLDYVPDFAFIVHLDPQNATQLSSLAYVRWVGSYRADYRLSLEAKALATFSVPEEQNPEEAEVTRLRIDAFPGEDSAAISAAVTALGGTVQEVVESSWGIRLAATVAAEHIEELAHISGIKWVEVYKAPRTSANVAADIIDLTNARFQTTGDGLYGENQVIAVCDSGLDRGSPTDIHPDFLDGKGNSRVAAIFRWGDYSSSQDSAGHGTHVAGLVLGNGQQSGADPANNDFPEDSFAGMAPKARLIFQAVGNPDFSSVSLPGLPASLTPLFQQALDASASIHSNSWGEAGNGEYTTLCEDVDQFCWDHKEFLVLFAGGNAGRDRDMDGMVDRYGLDTPATAKNCLTVGASESLRAAGGFAEMVWGSFRDYAEPINSDLTSDNAQGMASFSSRGPCLDGRIKPDLVAPGTNILSTRSAVQQGNGWGHYDDWYYYAGGTSMATPIVAGAAAVLRGYLTRQVETFKVTPPSSAMLKACLANAATGMEPGQYVDSGVVEVSMTPGVVAGWGRLNLENAVNPQAPDFITYVDNDTGLTTGEEIHYAVSKVAADSPLRINLAWTDYPSSAACNGGLVNDLDLMVTDQHGQVYYPDNALAQGAMERESYYDLSQGVTLLSASQVALRLTPDSYPKRLSSLVFAGWNDSWTHTPVTVEIYHADSGGEPTGNTLYSKTLANWGAGSTERQIITFEAALPVDIDITQGDVLVVFTFADAAATGLLGTANDAEGRALINTGGGWQASAVVPTVIGTFFSTDDAETFDRVNNVLGVTIDAPSGDYTVTVRGYNVPQGPQPFALVIRGTHEPEPEWGRERYPFWRQRR